MAKGYMIFLEGGEMPKVVHPNIAAAMFVAKRGDCMKIVTDFWMKPIPMRNFDWSAVTEQL
jgi:hypothetical protein